MRIDNRWVLGVANAKGSLDPDSSINKMWVYHTDKINVDDPGSSWSTPAYAVRANSLLHVNTQYCRYISIEDNNKIFWACLGGHAHTDDKKSNFLWGSEVDEQGLPINTQETFIDAFEEPPNGEISLNTGDYRGDSCHFRGGASISFSSDNKYLIIDCADWVVGNVMGHVRLHLENIGDKS